MKKILFALFFSVLMIVGVSSYIVEKPTWMSISAAQASKNVKVESGKYYGYQNGKLMKNRFTSVNGYYYYFTSNGSALVKSWKKIDGYDYYFGSNGKAYVGAKKIGTSLYGFSNSGKLLKNGGYKKIDGKFYYFNSKGISSKGLKKAGSYYRYFNGDGTIAKKTFKTINDKTYFFTKDGVMCTAAWRNISYDLGLSNAKYISCDENGVVREGLQTIQINGESNTYYFDKDLAKGVATGLKNIDGNIYYFKDSGKAATGLYTVGKYKYFFDEKGIAQTSQWVEVGKKKYYMASNGRSYVDVVKKVGKYTYYFTPSGYVHVGYKALNTSTGTKYYYFNSKGRSRSALLQVPDKDYSRYFNGDGTVATSEFKTIDNKLYFFTSAGILCQDEWRNIKFDLNASSAKYIATDPTTGEVKQGYTTISRDGSIYTYYMDPTTETGFRTGVQDCGDISYYFEIKGGNKGNLVYGFVTDYINKKLYYTDIITGVVLKDTTYTIPGTTATFKINEDGSFDTHTEIYASDNDVTRFIKIAMSQLFKDYTHLSISQMKQMELSEIPGFSCSGLVLRSLYELTKPEEMWHSNHDLCYEIYELSNADGSKKVFSPDYGQENLKPGDLVFINKDDCYNCVDDRGLPMIVDLNEDGICDREHETFIGEDGGRVSLHVHHVGIYLGNGYYLNSMPGKGVLVQHIPEDEKYEYVSAYARIFR